MKNLIKVTMILTLSIFIQNCAPNSDFDKASAPGSTMGSLSLAEGDESVGNQYGLTEEEYLQSLQEEPAQGLGVELNASIASKTKCTFYFRGEEGARWISERYTGADKNCSAELSIVKTKNPKATIVKIVENFVHDRVPAASKNKCTYFMRGQEGAEWFTERYIPSEDNCEAAELNIVRANNPRARITNIKSNFVHDSVEYASKTKCTFHLIGERGARWISERYIDADQSCSIENSIVRANNPKATINRSESNFVFDPF